MKWALVTRFAHVPTTYLFSFRINWSGRASVVAGGEGGEGGGGGGWCIIRDGVQKL